MKIGKSFGQQEPLTTRLHNLVRSYPKGLGILKEFIQNADDAEAKEIAFLIDEQGYDVTKMPESMLWLHRTPSLLVYNDKPFTDEDIEGIQNIGKSGKSNSVGKTGRFGLGFNACYNVTDVPSFFTRNELFFFDPHLKTVPGATVESPGQRFTVDEIKEAEWPILKSFEFFINGTSLFSATVFRLPFRTADQSKTSLIKKDPYTVNDAIEAVSELEQIGSAILLFLKHVRCLRVFHKSKSGYVDTLLHIEAENSKEITALRSEINRLLSYSYPIQLLDELSRRGSVYSSCCHNYVVKCKKRKRIEKWQVVDGFFVDEDMKILDACRKMIEHEEKALPYAGAAWPLDTVKKSVGRLYCFLPIPMQTSLPIQINSYFDLDDSRQMLFLDKSTQGTAKLRVQWNEILLKTSVAQAYVQLLEALKSELEYVNVDFYYKAFPKAVDATTSWEGLLTTAFYEYASVEQLIKVSGEISWREISETRTLPIELQQIGDSLILDNFLPIPCPSLPKKVLEGFSTNGIEVPFLTPHELRCGLKEAYDVDCTLKNAPKFCLRKRRHVYEILRFCLKDISGKDLHGLPLAIDCRGHLRTLGLTASSLYISKHQNDIEVFKEHPEWFVDPDMARELKLEGKKEVSLYEMDDDLFLQELATYVQGKTIDGLVKMVDDKSNGLTDAWLCLVFRRLLDSDLKGLEPDVNDIPLIPDQARRLWKMGSTNTPLLYSGTKALSAVLQEISVPLVSGVSSELYELLSKYSQDRSGIWQVTPYDLVDTLYDTCAETLDKYVELSNIQQALLNFFSKEENIVELEKHCDQLKKLIELKIFPTSNNLLVNLRETAYFPQNFDFPSVKFDVVLLNDGPQHRWRELYQLLDVRELSRTCVIEEVLLPNFTSLVNRDQYNFLCWLRDNLGNAQSENNDERAGVLFDQVRSAEIITCADGVQRAPKDVYQPESKLAREILDSQAALPDMQITYAKARERWSEFFRQLDMPTEPRLEDVVAYVFELIADEPSKEIAGRLQAVYDYIKRLVDAELQSNKEVSSELAGAVEELADTAWVPVRKEPGELFCFTPPEDPYARPEDVYFPRVGQLVASQACITVLRPEPSRRTRKVLGFPVKPDMELVVDHFKEVLALCEDDEKKPKEQDLIRALGQIYRFFGGEGPKEGDEPDEEMDDQETDDVIDLGMTFSNVPCIWDLEEKKFWRPDHVFSENVRYMKPWRQTIKSSEAIERGYMVLGCRQSPTLEDWKEVLEEIFDSGISSIDEQASRVVREVVRRIVDHLVEANETDGNVLVPTRRGQLVEACKTYVADAPWYDSMLDGWNIDVLSDSVAGILYIKRALRIPSLDESIEQRLTRYPADSELVEPGRECSRLESLLHSDEFASGLRRILYHEGWESSEYTFEFLKNIHVRCVKKIETCLYLIEDDVERLLSEAEADSYHDQETLEIMLSEKRPRYFDMDLAELLNRALADIRISDLSPLIRILSCDQNEIVRELDNIKVRNYVCDVQVVTDESEEIVIQDFPEEPFSEMASPEDGDEEVQCDEEPLPSETETDEMDEDNVYDGLKKIAEVLPEGHLEKAPLGSEEMNQGGDSSAGTGPQPLEEDKFGRTSEPGQLSSRAEAGGRTGTISARSQDGSKEGAHLPSAGTAGSHRDIKPESSKPVEQTHLVSYVHFTGSDATRKHRPAEDESEKIRIGTAAVDGVLVHERSKGRKVTPMPHNNPGYDVISEGCGETRYIEVKGTEGAWGVRGVALTASQFFYKREHPAAEHWLYVVENVFSNRAKVYEIKDPSSRVDRFMFDGGWKQIAEESADVESNTANSPSKGDMVLIDGVIVGTVEEYRPTGMFPLVIYTDLEGTQQRKLVADVTIQMSQS